MACLPFVVEVGHESVSDRGTILFGNPGMSTCIPKWVTCTNSTVNVPAASWSLPGGRMSNGEAETEGISNNYLKIKIFLVSRSSTLVDANPVFHYVRAMMDVAATLSGDVAPGLRVRAAENGRSAINRHPDTMSPVPT